MPLSRGRELGLMELTQQLTGVKQARLSTRLVHNSSGKYRFDSMGKDRWPRRLAGLGDQKVVYNPERARTRPTAR
jgi:hypothetical protein